MPLVSFPSELLVAFSDHHSRKGSDLVSYKKNSNKAYKDNFLWATRKNDTRYYRWECWLRGTEPQYKQSCLDGCRFRDSTSQNEENVVHPLN